MEFHWYTVLQLNFERAFEQAQREQAHSSRCAGLTDARSEECVWCVVDHQTQAEVAVIIYKSRAWKRALANARRERRPLAQMINRYYRDDGFTSRVMATIYTLQRQRVLSIRN